MRSLVAYGGEGEGGGGLERAREEVPPVALLTRTCHIRQVYHVSMGRWVPWVVGFLVRRTLPQVR